MIEVEQVVRDQSSEVQENNQVAEIAQPYQIEEIRNTLQLHFRKVGAKYYFPHEPEKYFTKREYKIFNCFLSGYISAKNIGDKLLLSHRTIEFHFANILKKLQCKSKFDIRKQAMALKLIS